VVSSFVGCVASVEKHLKYLNRAVLIGFTFFVSIGPTLLCKYQGPEPGDKQLMQAQSPK